MYRVIRVSRVLSLSRMVLKSFSFKIQTIFFTLMFSFFFHEDNSQFLNFLNLNSFQNSDGLK